METIRTAPAGEGREPGLAEGPASAGEHLTVAEAQRGREIREKSAAARQEGIGVALEAPHAPGAEALQPELAGGVDRLRIEQEERRREVLQIAEGTQERVHELGGALEPPEERIAGAGEKIRADLRQAMEPRTIEITRPAPGGARHANDPEYVIEEMAA